jgi:hypothetical protein
VSNPPGIGIALALTPAAVVINFLAMGPAVILLNIGLIAALIAWLTTGEDWREPHRLIAPVFVASIVVQALHFSAEYQERLYETLPPLFGLEPIGATRFAAFNGVWLLIFVVAAIGVYRKHRLALLMVWFMALLGCIGNAVFHGWLAMRSGGYSPDVVTALLNLPIGVFLIALLTGPQGRDDLERSITS